MHHLFSIIVVLSPHSLLPVHLAGGKFAELQKSLGRSSGSRGGTDRMGRALAPLAEARRRLAARREQGRRETSGLGSDKERCPGCQLTSGLTREEVTAASRAEAVTGTRRGRAQRGMRAALGASPSSTATLPAPAFSPFPSPPGTRSQCLGEPELGVEAKSIFGSQETSSPDLWDTAGDAASRAPQMAENPQTSRGQAAPEARVLVWHPVPHPHPTGDAEL